MLITVNVGVLGRSGRGRVPNGVCVAAGIHTLACPPPSTEHEGGCWARREGDGALWLVNVPFTRD